MSELRAVVIDDDLSLGHIFKLALEKAGFEVIYISDSTLAMEKLLEFLPDLITLDLQMPNVSGLDVLHAMRRDERLAQVKVIMMTANSYALNDETINDLADLTLLKPVSVSQISSLALRLTGAENS
jgi:two-component system, cell cycle response regulator DivK